MLKNVCLRTKFDLMLKQKTKSFGVNFGAKFCFAIKKMPVIHLSYLENV